MDSLGLPYLGLAYLGLPYKNSLEARYIARSQRVVKGTNSATYEGRERDQVVTEGTGWS